MEICSHNKFDPLTILLKVNGIACNLRCDYCSERKKNYCQPMELSYITEIMKEAPSNCSIILHGGEPLLDVSRTQSIIETHAKTRGVRLHIQTNGCFSREIGEVLCANAKHIHIGVSLDGPASLNCLRKNYCGQETFKQVIKNIEALLQWGIPVKCIATIHTKNVFAPDMFLDFFLSLQGITQLRINPCFDIINDQLSAYAISPSQFLGFLQHITQRWIQESLYLRMRIDPIQAQIEDLTQGGICTSFNRCSKFISVYSNRRCTPCDTFGDQCFYVQNWNSIFQEGEIFLKKRSTFFSKNPSPIELSMYSNSCPAIVERLKNNQQLLQEYFMYQHHFFFMLHSLRKEFGE